MRVAFQCDPFETLNPQTDTSLALMTEALVRGFQVYHYTPQDLSWAQEGLMAQGNAVALKEGRVVICKEIEEGQEGGHLGFNQGEAHPSLESAQHTGSCQKKSLRLDHMNVVWIRQDPPFNMTYLTPTYLLETLSPKTLILNDPAGIRSAPEKLLMTHFPDLLPPTLMTSHQEKALSFLQEHREIVLKPLYDYGGKSIFHLKAQGDLGQTQKILDERWRTLAYLYPQEPFICQVFLPEVYEGDKRLFLLEGQYIGGFKKMPLKGEFRSNLAVGGHAIPHEATDRDREICATIGPVLKEMGLFFVGIDVIGEWLTEINVTSPTGLKAFENLYKRKLEQEIWDAVEKRLL